MGSLVGVFDGACVGTADEGAKVGLVDVGNRVGSGVGDWVGLWVRLLIAAQTAERSNSTVL